MATAFGLSICSSGDNAGKGGQGYDEPMKRLLLRLGTMLGIHVSGLGAHDLVELPCAACGEPATGWSYFAHDRGGQRVIDGYATCAAHRSDESPGELTETRAG